MIWIIISSVESQKGINDVQRCSVENQKGTVAVQSHRCFYKVYMVITPFWFSMEHLWIEIAPFWLSTDDMSNTRTKLNILLLVIFIIVWCKHSKHDLNHSPEIRGGGGGWGQLPEYFMHCLPENQVVLPEYYMIFFFCPKIAIWKITGEGGGGGIQPILHPPLVRLWRS